MKKTQTIKDSDFESIIPTALHTAYPLIFTDIPYSQEIFDKLSENGFADNLKNDKLAFELEARHKLIDKFVKESGIKQILEIASGFTASGLNICKSDKNVKYIELDLPKVIQKKKQILSEFTQIPNNMFFVEGNVLRFKDKSDVEEFLAKNNLKIEWRDFAESVDMLSSKKQFGLTNEEVVPYLEHAYVGIITMKTSVE